MSLQAVADRLDVSPQAVHQFEKSEVAGTISLRQLGLVAGAMGCRVSYRIEAEGAGEKGDVSGTVHGASPVSPPASVAEPNRPRTPVASESIARSLFLDNQESGRFD
ncbi:MAG: hypothetical protein HZA93_06505 [Verrucomicrobia bacterium]|nr:hypothetical protein [Verrucomicrobiota bacterium]